MLRIKKRDNAKATRLVFKKRYLHGAIAVFSVQSVAALAATCPAPSGTELVVSGAVDETCAPTTGVNTTVTSGGSIIQTVTANVDGIQVNTGVAAGTITVGGVIDTTARSIFVGGSATAVENSGTIKTVYVTGTIQSLQNSGNITNGGDNSVWIKGGTVGSGGVVNTATGSISGANVGLDAENAAQINGDIVNQGQLSGIVTGIHLDTNAQLNGSLINDTGATLSAPTGILVSGAATVSGDLVNRGTITATDTGISLYQANLTGNLDNSGSIQSTDAVAVSILNSPLVGGFVNQSNGTIASTHDTGLKIQYSTLTHSFNNGGSITGGDAGVGFGNSVIQSGGFINSGSITSSNYAGLDMWSSQISGDFLNSGTISSPNFGVQMRDVTTLHGNLINQGTLSGGTYGLLLSGVTVDGDVRNDGTIRATAIGGSAISMTSNSGTTTIGGALVNGASGVVSASGDAVTLSNVGINGGVSNAGNITSSDAAGIVLDTVTTSGSSGISNSGTITAATTGLQITQSTVGGNIDNSGRIQATDAGGTALKLSSVTLGGVLNNSGVLQGATALDLNATPALTVNNSGQLNGAVLLGDSTLNIAGTTSQLNGAVSGTSNSVVNILGSLDSSSSLNVGSVTIGSQATYVARGNISVAQALTNSGTLVVHTATPVTLTGDYTQNATAVYSVVADSTAGATSVTPLTVTGTATLAAGTTINVNVLAASLVAKNSLRLLSARNLVASSLNITDNSYLLNFVPQLSGDALSLTAVNAASITDAVQASADRRALSLARALDGGLTDANAANAVNGNAVQLLQSAFQRQPDAASVTHAVDQLLPLFSGSGAAIMLEGGQRAAQAGDLRNQQELGGSPDDVRLWLTPFREFTRVSGDADNGAHGYRLYNNGFQLGGLAPVAGSRAVAGMNFSYYHSDYRNGDNAAAQTATTDQVYVAALGHVRGLSGFGIDAQIGGGLQHAHGQRTVTLTDSPQLAQGSLDGWHAHAGAGLSYLWQSDSWRITPRVALDYDMARNAGYSENGAGIADLQVAAQSAQTGAASLGLTLQRKFATGWDMTFYGSSGYDIFASYPAQQASLANGLIPFQVQGQDPGRWKMRTGAAMSKHFGNSSLLELRYDLAMRRDTLNQLVVLAFRQYF